MPSIVRLFGLVLVLGALAGPVRAQDVVREDVPGIRNLARIGTTIACAGAITPEAAPGIAATGFRSVLSLWTIKRIAVDGWDVARATEEAVALGSRSEAMQAFAAAFGLANRH